MHLISITGHHHNKTFFSAVGRLFQAAGAAALAKGPLKRGGAKTAGAGGRRIRTDAGRQSKGIARRDAASRGFHAYMAAYENRTCSEQPKSKR